MGAFKTLGNFKEIREGWACLCDAHEVVITAGLALPESAAYGYGYEMDFKSKSDFEPA